MNPKLKQRGPSAIEGSTSDMVIQEKTLASANNVGGLKPTANAKPAVQRKMTEDDETVQRKEKGTGGRGGSADFQASLAAAKGSGSALDGSVQKSFGAKFGADFRNVKIHTDSKATQLSESIQAKAFATGNHIYFNQGQYNPNTREGKKLLAHELTHTIQQGASQNRVQRKAEEKEHEVVGILRKSQQGYNAIYFDKNEASLTFEQESRIFDAMLKNMRSTDIYLSGFASEDEVDRPELIEKRLDMVEAKVKRLKREDVKVHRLAEPEVGKNNPYYRKFRSVQIKTEPKNKEKEKRESGGDPIGCDQENTDIIANHKKETLQHFDNLIQLMENNGKPMSPLSQPVLMLDKFFNSTTGKTQKGVLKKLKQARHDLDQYRLTDQLFCESNSYVPCDKNSAVTQTGNKIVFCDRFFNGPVPYQKFTFIHELMHFSKIYLTDDAYEYQRIFLFLSAQEALNNADTMTAFMWGSLGIDDPYLESTVTDPNRDKLSGCNAHDNELKEMIAKAEKYNSSAETLLMFYYQKKRDLTDLRYVLQRYFGRFDFYEMAGMIDKINRMSRVYNKNFEISCLPKADSKCNKSELIIPISLTKYLICPQFFDLSKKERTFMFGSALARQMFNVSDKQIEGLGKIGYKLKHEY